MTFGPTLQPCELSIAYLQMNMEDAREQQRQQQHVDLTAYYETFNDLTNNGRVFVDGLSKTKVDIKTLTLVERSARERYQNILSQLVRAYPIHRAHPIATTQEQVLQQRVVAPCLKPNGNVSYRSAASEARAGRMYPRNIHPWTGFQEAVEGFHLDNSTPLNEVMNGIFYDSLRRARHLCRNEAGEQGEIIENLSRTLIDAGIIHSVEEAPPLPVKIDFGVKKDENTYSIICECKSTHNLLLPMTADDCKATYDAAYDHGATTSKRSPAWSNVAHPLGQLLAYMVDLKHRYGVLTSGTKTYFVTIQKAERCITDIGRVSHVQKSDEVNHDGMTTCSSAKRLAVAVHPGIHNEKTQSRSPLAQAAMNLFSKVASKRHIPSDNDNSDDELDGGVKVYISDAWCVGEENYLRAWAYMHTLQESADPWKEPTDWIKSTPKMSKPNLWGRKQAPSRKPSSRKKLGKPTSPSDIRDSNTDNSGHSTKRCNLDYYYLIHRGVLDYVPYDDIEFLGVLGDGRNGACFKVQWNGVECAMKQFDIGRDGDTNFEKEIQAYMLLQKAWGVLVPRPLFLSESFSGGRLFLGLQLGRESTNDDDLPKYENVLWQLETNYGIRHSDAECGRNMIVITDEKGNERVVAIDLEDWVEV